WEICLSMRDTLPLSLACLPVHVDTNHTTRINKRYVCAVGTSMNGGLSVVFEALDVLLLNVCLNETDRAIGCFHSFGDEVDAQIVDICFGGVVVLLLHPGAGINSDGGHSLVPLAIWHSGMMSPEIFLQPVAFGVFLGTTTIGLTHEIGIQSCGLELNGEDVGLGLLESENVVDSVPVFLRRSCEIDDRYTCTTDKTSQLRFVYDKISINVRGLEALGVNSSQYGSLLIPLEILHKMCGISDGIKVTPEKPKAAQPKPPPHGSAAALVANGQPSGNKIQCVYCSGHHFSASCTKTNEVHARLEILKRDRRCFVCLKRGHRSNQCSNQRGCRRCNGIHHQSICNQQIPTLKPDAHEPAAATKGNEDSNAHAVHVQ
ncbi:E3 ubiquitin- ligase DZIP3, partial [Paramuricea clavata]